MTRTKITILSLLVTLTLVALLVRTASPPREGTDLKPRPDALEYGVAASSLVERGSYSLPIADEDYPPRYPFGFSLLATPFVKARGGAPEGARDASLTFGVLTVPLAAILAHLVAGPAAALFAGALIALSPLSIRSSVLALSESSSMLLWVLTLLLVAIATRTERTPVRTRCWFGAGMALGLAATVRYTNLALLLPTLLALLIWRRGHSEGSSKNLLLFLSPVAIGLLSLGYYNWMTFGSPLANGYEFWVPDIYHNSELLFSSRYLFSGVEGYWENGHLQTYGRSLLGLDPGMLSLLAAGLTVPGLLFVYRRASECPPARLVLLTTLTSLPAVLIFHLCYFWQDPRFLLPLLPVLAILGGAGFAAVLDLVSRSRPRGSIVVITALILLTASLWPLVTRSYELVEQGEDAELPPPLMEVLPSLDGQLSQPSLLIVNFPVTLANRALGEGREIMVTDRNDADPHLNLIHRHQLTGKNGRRPSTRALAAGNEVHEETLLYVRNDLRAGRDVYVVHCVGEGQGTAGIDALKRHASLEEVLNLSPVTVFRVQPR